MFVSAKTQVFLANSPSSDLRRIRLIMLDMSAFMTYSVNKLRKFKPTTLERFHVLLRPNSLPLASLERDFGPTFVSMSRGNALISRVFVAATSVVVASTPPAATANSLNTLVVDTKTAGILNFIGSIEAPAGYNAYSYYASSPPPKPLTTMTISEVLAWQERIDRTSKSEAAGRYQIMEDTLRDYLVPTLGLTGREVFNAKTQDQLAYALMLRREWNPKGRNYIEMANQLAREWAALPLVSGPNRGKSFHHNTKGAKNRAQATPEAFLNVLMNGEDRVIVSAAISQSRKRQKIAVRPAGNAALLKHNSKTLKTTEDSETTLIVYQVNPYGME
jgi:hypothetical protein